MGCPQGKSQCLGQLCILCWGWEKLLLRKYFEGLHLTGKSLCPHRIISMCHGRSLLPLSSSAIIVLETTSVSGCKNMKSLEWWCGNLCEQLEQMVWSVNCWRRKQKRWVNKVLLSLTFFHGFVLHWPLKSTNLNWIWVPQRHHKWFQNQ